MWNAVRDTAETQRDSVSRTPLCTTEPESSKAHPARRTASMSKKARWLHREAQLSTRTTVLRRASLFQIKHSLLSPTNKRLSPAAASHACRGATPSHATISQSLPRSESASCGWCVPTSLGGSRERQGPGRSGQYDLSEGHPSTPTTCHQVRGSIVGFSEFLKRSQKCSFFLTKMSLI